MEYVGFKIKNFKGICSAELKLDSVPNSPIMTLVGLNESGKTTILEAISYLETKEKHLEALSGGDYQHSKVDDLVPLSKKANFNDAVEISAELTLSDNDLSELKEIAKKLAISLDEKILGRNFTITRRLSFEKSEFKKSAIACKVPLYGKIGRGKKNHKLSESYREEWVKLVNHLISKTPPIIYFPTFLFDFPDKIYLNALKKETQTNKYYRLIIQDILDYLNDDLNIADHIVGRALKADLTNRRSLAAVLAKMSNSISKIIFGSWDEILDKKVAPRNIEIAYQIEDPESDDPKVFLEFTIKDAGSQYLLSERSLGFRWFFSFLLFTQFRTYRKTNDNCLFLF